MGRNIWRQASTLMLIATLVACSGPPRDEEPSEPATTSDPQQSKRPSQTAAYTPALESGARKSITCHELINGEPSRDSIVYELDRADFYRYALDGSKHLISSEGKLVPLGRTVDDEGPEDSFASHTLQGDMLTRTVLWQRAGQPPRTAFVERFDFRAQSVSDDDGADTCYHDVTSGTPKRQQ